jgi:hypothetical protein
MIDVKHFACNELKRFKIEFGKLFSIRLHKWITGDPENYQHAHPWNFLTIVLWGGYDDVGDGRPTDRVRAPAIRYRPMSWRHAVTNCLPHTVSIVITGRVLDKWRFWIGRDRVDIETWNARKC